MQSLVNSAHVNVTIYRGLDPLLTDATGNDFLPGGTERIDTRFGRKFIQHLAGRISNGVLTTEPHDITFPWAVFDLPADEYMRAARFELKLTPTPGRGVDRRLCRHRDLVPANDEIRAHTSPELRSAIAIVALQGLSPLADAYPDPKTGANTAISSALRVQFVQVFVLHPQDRTMEAANTRLQTPYAGTPVPRAPADELAEGGSKLAHATSGSSSSGTAP